MPQEESLFDGFEFSPNSPKLGAIRKSSILVIPQNLMIFGWNGNAMNFWKNKTPKKSSGWHDLMASVFLRSFTLVGFLRSSLEKIWKNFWTHGKSRFSKNKTMPHELQWLNAVAIQREKKRYISKRFVMPLLLKGKILNYYRMVSR